MQERIEQIISKLGKLCEVEMAFPTPKFSLYRLEMSYPDYYKKIEDLYKVTDGIEIDVPGTIIYSAEEVIKKNWNRNTDQNLIIGRMCFGDIIVLNKDGSIFQIDHENDEVFLDWNDIEHLLNDELRALE